MNTAPSVDAFGVRTTALLSKHDDMLSFNDLIRNVCSSNFDLSSGIFSVPASRLNFSLYWMHAGNKINFDLNYSTDNPKYLMRHSPGETTLRLSRSLVISLKPFSSVSVKTNSSILANTLYWSSFQLNNLMHPLVVILATCYNLTKTIQTRSTHNSTKQLIKVFYNTVVINEGQAWNFKNSLFTVRHSGIYLFSVRAKLEIPSFSNSNIKLCRLA